MAGLGWMIFEKNEGCGFGGTLAEKILDGDELMLEDGPKEKRTNPPLSWTCWTYCSWKKSWTAWNEYCKVLVKNLEDHASL